MDEKERRKSVSISMDPDVKAYLEDLRSSLVLEDGKPYPLSYLVEDMILWIIGDGERLEKFLDDNYENLEGDSDEEDEEDEEEDQSA